MVPDGFEFSHGFGSDAKLKDSVGHRVLTNYAAISVIFWDRGNEVDSC